MTPIKSQTVLNSGGFPVVRICSNSSVVDSVGDYHMQQDYCGRICESENNNRGLVFGCWFQLPWQMEQQSTMEKSRLVTEGLETLADQVSEDLKSNDIVILQRAIIICRDLLSGHIGSSKKLVIESLRDRGVVPLLIDQLLFRIDELNIITCQCLSQLINVDTDIQLIIDTGLINKLTSAISSPDFLSAVVISLFLILLQSKNEILQILISMERADTSNILISLLQKINNNNFSEDSLNLLKVLQILMKRSQLAVGQVLKLRGLEIFCRWLGNSSRDELQDESCSHFEIGFEIVIDLIRKHENLSIETKIDALEQLYKGGIVNTLIAILHYRSPFLQQIIYALSELCQVEGVAEVLSHLLSQNQYHLLIDIVCQQCTECNNQDTSQHAQKIIRSMLQSQEGFNAFRSLVRYNGIVPLVQNTHLGKIIVNKGCSQGGLALLQGLGSGQEADVTAASEALAAMTIFEPLLCAPILLHGNLTNNLISKFLSFFSSNNSNNAVTFTCNNNIVGLLSDQQVNQSQGQQVDQIEGNALIQIVLRLFSELSRSCQDEGLVRRSWSKTSSVHEKFSRDGILQSQNSSASTISSLSQASIPRDEVNIKRYDSATFLIGGKESYALGWVMEQHSPFIQKNLQNLKNIKEEKISVPHIPGVSNSKLYEVFQLAVEFAYTGQILNFNKNDVLALWALSRQLQMGKLQERCEEEISEQIIFENEINLFLIFQWVFEGGREQGKKKFEGRRNSNGNFCNNSNNNNNKILNLCMDGIAYHFEDLYKNGTIQQLLNKYPNQIESGLAAHLRRRLQASIHDSNFD